MNQRPLQGPAGGQPKKGQKSKRGDQKQRRQGRGSHDGGGGGLHQHHAPPRPVNPDRRKFKNIFLVGMPGSGKSTLGKSFAYLTQRNFLDLDRYIEDVTQKKISEIFETEGETSFRETEARVLRKLGRLQNHVIALGGGTLCFADNLQFVQQLGVVVWVDADLVTLAQRIFAQKEIKKRPLFNDAQTVADIKARVSELLSNRLEFYERADLKLSSAHSSVDTLSLELLELEQKTFYRDYQRVVAAVGGMAPPHVYPQGPFWLMRRGFTRRDDSPVEQKNDDSNTETPNET